MAPRRRRVAGVARRRRRRRARPHHQCRGVPALSDERRNPARRAQRHPRRHRVHGRRPGCRPRRGADAVVGKPDPFVGFRNLCLLFPRDADADPDPVLVQRLPDDVPAPLHRCSVHGHRAGERAHAPRHHAVHRRGRRARARRGRLYERDHPRRHSRRRQWPDRGG